ncbi:MAG: thiosulfate oxidation carrier complex protein SoxZ [bacterium]
MKIKAKMKADVAIVKVLIKHPMHNGLSKNKKTGKVIPAKFIQEVTADVKGKRVFTAYLNTSISKDPFLSFSFKGASAGDKITMAWRDSTGETGSGETVIK